VKDNELYDKSLNQHQTEIILPITELATSALIVVANEPTAKTYTIREEIQNSEKKNESQRQSKRLSPPSSAFPPHRIFSCNTERCCAGRAELPEGD
jgi:hypothetical protein